MANIYQISQELEDIFFELEENGGELTPELEERLAISQEELKSKLDSYRKAYTALTLDSKQCKEEEQRIANLRKSKERNAARIKDVMLNAVLAYGNNGKSGNKTIDLTDSKLYTKNTKCTELDETYISTFIDCVLGVMSNANDIDMLDELYQEIDENTFIEKINNYLQDNFPDTAERLIEERGHYFTLDDLYVCNISFNITIPANVIIRLPYADLMSELLFNKDRLTVTHNIDKSVIGRMLDNYIDTVFGRRINKQSLIIK